MVQLCGDVKCNVVCGTTVWDVWCAFYCGCIVVCVVGGLWCHSVVMRSVLWQCGMCGAKRPVIA